MCFYHRYTFSVKLASKTDLRAYSKCKAAGSEGQIAKEQIANPKMIASATENFKRQKLK